MEPEAIMPAAWRTAGARFGRDGLLYLPEWRRGFDVNELRSMFWRCQQVRTLERENAQLASEREQLAQACDAAEARAQWYRRQLSLESRLGLCLARITS